jgi:hypothetical protein
MTPLTDFCRAKVMVMFPVAQQKEVIELLERQVGGTIPDLLAIENPGDFDGIRCAVLKLSGGDIEKLRHWVKKVRINWRAVLDAADFGHDGDAHTRWEPRKAA